MGPVGGGRLSGFSSDIAKMVSGGVKSNPEIALRFVLSHPGVSCAISGMGSAQMVEENVATASREDPLSAEERAQIMAALDQTKRLADLYCTGCGYCMPCSNDVNIPKNFEYMNYYRVYGLREFARQTYADLGVKNTEGLKAEFCLQCGECEPKCPQNIPIMAQLEEVARTLG
jgi:hypothetical protein